MWKWSRIPVWQCRGSPLGAKVLPHCTAFLTVAYCAINKCILKVAGNWLAYSQASYLHPGFAFLGAVETRSVHRVTRSVYDRANLQ